MKAATTWVWHQLRAHPQIMLPWQKEIHYFDKLEETPENYLSRFSKMAANKQTGEVTPAYLTVPHAPLLARSLCPKAKVFAVLRNPIDRAFSHWKVAQFAEGKIPFGTGLRASFDGGHPWPGPFWHSIQEKGCYLKYLKRWYSCFPEAQIKVLWYDDIEKDPIGFLVQLYDYLGVDSDFVPKNYLDKKNENWSGRNPVMKPEDHQHMLEFYLPGIERLEKFTGRDLSAWKKIELAKPETTE